MNDEDFSYDKDISIEDKVNVLVAAIAQITRYLVHKDPNYINTLQNLGPIQAEEMGEQNVH